MKNGNISRRQLLQASAALGCLAATPLSVVASDFAGADQPHLSAVTNPLKPPAEGPIPVAFLVSDGAVVIDFAGPWEVFQDVMIPGHMDMAFQLFTVSESTKPIQAQRWHEDRSRLHPAKRSCAEGHRHPGPERG